MNSDFAYVGGHNNDLCPTCAGATLAAEAPSFTPGEWHHMTATFDGQTLRVYVDGILNFYGPKQFNTAAGESFNVGFSASEHLGGEPFLGTLQSVGMWDRALSGEEVALMYAKGSNAGMYRPCCLQFRQRSQPQRRQLLLLRHRLHIVVKEPFGMLSPKVV